MGASSSVAASYEVPIPADAVPGKHFAIEEEHIPAGAIERGTSAIHLQCPLDKKPGDTLTVVVVKAESGASDVDAAQAREDAIRVVFDRYDRDSNGVIEMTELVPMLRELGFVDADAASEMVLADASGDGLIQWAEFVVYHNVLKVRQSIRELRRLRSEFYAARCAQCEAPLRAVEPRTDASDAKRKTCWSCSTKHGGTDTCFACPNGCDCCYCEYCFAKAEAQNERQQPVPSPALVAKQIAIASAADLMTQQQEAEWLRLEAELARVGEQDARARQLRGAILFKQHVVATIRDIVGSPVVCAECALPLRRVRPAPWDRWSCDNPNKKGTWTPAAAAASDRAMQKLSQRARNRERLRRYKAKRLRREQAARGVVDAETAARACLCRQSYGRDDAMYACPTPDTCNWVMCDACFTHVAGFHGALDLAMRPVGAVVDDEGRLRVEIRGVRAHNNWWEASANASGSGGGGKGKGGKGNGREKPARKKETTRENVRRSRARERRRHRTVTVIVSDRRLKRDIARIGTSPSGLPVCSWRYAAHGARGPRFSGVLAQDLVAAGRGDAVVCVDGASGVLAVDYSRIDVLCTLIE